MTMELLIGLMMTVFLMGFIVGSIVSYWSFKKSFKLGVRDALVRKSPAELKAFREILDSVEER